jgi:outer membrane murein-binding lipoprotein Lpp
MGDWLDNLSFSDLILAGSTLIAAIAAYFNLNNKLDNISTKVGELEKSQDEVKTEIKEVELNHKKELVDMSNKQGVRMLSLEERQRVFDLFMARFEEKINYISDQVSKLNTHWEKKNDK